MIRNKALFLILFLTSCLHAFGQAETPTDSLPDPQKEQVEAMVSTVEFYFNLLGSKRTTTREKETIINQSYQKLFLNDRVQIEDDLQENRSTQIFKDVQAYLKDVDFFFQQAVFEFEVDTVERLYTTDSVPYFKAEILRNLTAIDLQGDTLTITGQRFMEFNLDGPKGELKVASMYSNKIDRAKQLKYWWLSLSVGWKKIFQDEIGIYDDSLTVDELTRIAGMDSLDLTDNDRIISLDPIYVLTDLAYLKLTNSFINDLSPLRSITRLKVLDISQSSIHDLSHLKYHTDIQQMILFNSHVTDFSVLETFGKLKLLDLRDASGLDLGFVGGLKSLTDINLSGASGTDSIDFSQLENLRMLNLEGSDMTTLTGFEHLNQLRELNLTSTKVNTVETLKSLGTLITLNISKTQVKDILPLSKLKSLAKLDVNGLPLEQAQIDTFIENSNALLVRKTEELSAWWNELSFEWKTVFSERLDLPNPTAEELVKLLELESLDANNAGVKSLEPLRMLNKLTTLNVSDNNIRSLNGIEGLDGLKVLKLSTTNVSDLAAIKGLSKLSSIEASNTRIRSIDELIGLSDLRSLDVDGTAVNQAQVDKLLNANPSIKIRFQTQALKIWWSGLSPELQAMFRNNLTLSAEPSSTELHELASIKEVELSGALDPDDLSSFDQLFRLETLILSRTGLSSLDLLPNVSTLKSLSITESPLSDPTSILRFKKLSKLDISNTAVTDLRPLVVLTDLKDLNFSGTTIRRLRGLESLLKLEKVDCSNTGVSRLDELFKLPVLSHVTCFNSRLNSKDIDALKRSQPEVEIVFY